MLWTKSLETGVAKIDEQHKELFRQADILVDPSQKDRAESTLDFLKTYVNKHFVDEETLHKTSQYPKADSHKKLHVDFTGALKGLYQQYSVASNKSPAILAINSAVVGWLKNHIMLHDKEFTTYYLQRNSK
jgi:hemerythrin